MQAEIKKCWEQLISEKHKKALEAPHGAQPYELVAEALRYLGGRFAHSEYIFPPGDLIPLLEIYAYEHQRDVGTPGWVVDTFVEAGVPEETVLRVLEAMFWQDEVPFKGTARRRLLADAVYAVEKWWMKVVKRGGDGFRLDDIRNSLKSMVSVVPQGGAESERVDRLLADMQRRGGLA